MALALSWLKGAQLGLPLGLVGWGQWGWDGIGVWVMMFIITCS